MRTLPNKILIKMDIRQKERYSLGNGKVLEIQKGFDFNRRLDYPSMAIIIHGEGLPKDAEILVHHNVSEPTYLVPDKDILTDAEREHGYKVYSIPKDMGFCYKENGEWIPCEYFLITERIFREYSGKLVGIPHEQIKNILYIVKGKVEDAPDLEGKVCIVTEHSDYEIIWTNKENKIESLIRTRSREILAVNEKFTNELKSGKYMVGLNANNCKQFKKYQNAVSERQ